MRGPENHFTHLTHLDSFVSQSTSWGDTLINILTLAKDAITAPDVKRVEARERQLFSDKTVNAASNLRYDQQRRSRSAAENPQTLLQVSRPEASAISTTPSVFIHNRPQTQGENTKVQR